MDSSVALRITKARSSAGMTQNDLALASDIAPAQISRYEQGRNIPRTEALAKIAKALGVSFDWLAYGAGEAEPVLPIEVMPSEDLRKQIQKAADANNRTMNAEIVARLQNSFDLAPPDRIAVDTSQGMKVYAPQAELPSADEIADKVADRLAERMRIPPLSKEALEHYMGLYLRRDESFNERWKEEFGYNPEAPKVQQHGGPPAKSSNAKRSLKKT